MIDVQTVYTDLVLPRDTAKIESLLKETAEHVGIPWKALQRDLYHGGWFEPETPIIEMSLRVAALKQAGHIYVRIDAKKRQDEERRRVKRC